MNEIEGFGLRGHHRIIITGYVSTCQACNDGELDICQFISRIIVVVQSNRPITNTRICESKTPNRPTFEMSELDVVLIIDRLITMRNPRRNNPNPSAVVQYRQGELDLDPLIRREYRLAEFKSNLESVFSSRICRARSSWLANGGQCDSPDTDPAACTQWNTT